MYWYNHSTLSHTVYIYMYVYIMCTFFQSKSCIFIYLSIIPFNETREKDRGRERQRETERQREDREMIDILIQLITIY